MIKATHLNSKKVFMFTVNFIFIMIVIIINFIIMGFNFMNNNFDRVMDDKFLVVVVVIIVLHLHQEAVI